MKRLTSSTLTILVAAAVLVLGGIGVTVAATGGTFLLGKSNSASTTTSLTNSQGTALSLSSKSGTPPLKVNNTTKATNLNADLLDGLSSSSFQRRVSASCAFGLKALGSTGAATCVPGIQRFSTAGTHTYTVPTGVHLLQARVWGGGGGGGGSRLVDAEAGHNGAGGGQGGYVEVLIPVTAGNVLTVVVGAAGAGGDTVTATPATDGLDSVITLASVAIATGKGGSGAFDPGPMVCPDDGGAHGAGGAGGDGRAVAPAVGLAAARGLAGTDWHADCGMPIGGGQGGGATFAAAGAGGDGAASDGLNTGNDGSTGLVLITPVG